ncbi:hypothetical protein HPB50_021121 [Hyalomma asiaticum]|uniref:Uncharacterized protein n=1 Tax=Hyalomma asiaticum TaxID=266040 RepID=A0ACB7SK42_HYAAI|nr:hypothetical protein HPB50_021121 [Hyalomma asiaticum]
MPEGYIKMGLEEDGTPCRFFVHEGVCQNGLCLLDKPRKERPAKGDGDKEGGAVTPKADEGRGVIHASVDHRNGTEAFARMDTS